MYKLKGNKLNISVRNLVEFILRSGDIDNRTQGTSENAMLLGAQLHRRIQSRMGSHYSAEVPLKAEYEKGRIIICLEGRADGIIDDSGVITIDEIKGTYTDLEKLEEPVVVHIAQAKCYAYMVLAKRELSEIYVQLTYSNMETEEIKRFKNKYDRAELEEWFEKLIDEFAVWGNFIFEHKEKRNATIKGLKFPFEYRKGQKELAVYTYRTIVRGKKMFVQAPTGIGKTMSMIYPSVMAMGENTLEKIFYLTAKTITRTVAEESCKRLGQDGLDMLTITITAKEKVCILDKPDCNPLLCPRAKGHYDRINEAVFYALCNYRSIGRDEVLAVAQKFNVCPFELSLDISSFVDSIICDYNYVFDPNVKLKRYFADSSKGDYVFLIDEAHNLVERARNMYSAQLVKEDFLAVDRIVKEYSKKLHKRLSACNRSLLELKKTCEDIEVLDSITHLVLNLMSLLEEMSVFSEDFPQIAGNEQVKEFYFAVRHFLNMYDLVDENYRIYSKKLNNGSFMVKLLCIDPSNNISLCTNCGRASVFFSATLLPMKYYCEMISKDEDDYKVYVDSPFDSSKRLLAVADDVSGRYSRRNKKEYQKVIDYILKTTNAKSGNYMVFFPSYQYLNSVLELADEQGSFEHCVIARQQPEMDEAMREEFLQRFKVGSEDNKTVLGLCVMGGIFSEGIDLKGESLIGVFIIGTGIGQISRESDIYRAFYEARGENGFDMTHTFPGMNKVLQAAGRVIRTEEDEGVIMLLDDRFLRREYQELFPKEWQNFKKISISDVSKEVSDFWKQK